MNKVIRYFILLFCIATGFVVASAPMHLRSQQNNWFLKRTRQIVGKTNAVGEVVGTLKGNFEVNAKGSAVYSIPIDVPPGTADMTPEISITYNSSQPDGVLGMGFGIEGLTAITRVGQNLTENGKIHGVDFTNNDRFALDTQQLVAINGSYGGNNTEYRTYTDSFSKLVSYGVQGNGPQWFKVWTKGGQIAEYGHTDDSRILAQGKNTAASWELDKIIDRSGNYLTVHYTQDKTNGEFYTSEIDYTANDAKSVKPYNAVKFIYETRPDVITHYRAGSMMKLTKRLKEIQVYNATDTATPKLVYDYKFTYEQSASTGRSRLIRPCPKKAEIRCLALCGVL